MTQVVRIRRKGGKVVQGCDIYIGRRMTMGGWDLPESDWANPFTVKEHGSREVVCQMYEEYLFEKRPDLLARLGELKGRTLGCWCAPKECHGHVLARLADDVE